MLHGTILISGGDVTAKGGYDGSGIGCGDGGSFKDDEEKGVVKITGGTINATGGENGAGIGGGNGSDYMDIQIDQAEGANLSITAQGGANAAGIGSGDEDCDDVSVKLRGGYVYAKGGSGGAGIGAGGYLFHKNKNDPIPNTNDTQSVEIKSGYVKATGGTDDTDDAGYNTGSGAGIGGGAAGTRLKNLTISGGWVEAYAGDANAAAIGHGGKANGGGAGTDDSSNLFTVSAGTVVADTMGANATKVFDGGSITTKVSDAHNSAGTAVYQTTMKTIDDPLKRVDVRPNCGSYGNNPIYDDAECKVYLYLPVSDENQQSADLYIEGWADHMHYYGTTTTSNDGWLKMDGEALPATAYDAKSGSVVLSLKPSYLQELSAGTHTLEPQFDDGAAQKVGFTIAEAKAKGQDGSNATTNVARTTVPNTADSSSCALPFALLGIAALILSRTANAAS